MNVSLSITVPDDISVAELAAYLREQADNAAGQLEEVILEVPSVDVSVYIHMGDDREAILYRSE